MTTNLISRAFLRRAAQAKRSFSFPFSRYNKKYNCTFIHIPKVAGTSIVQALSQGKAQRNHLPWYVYYTANPIFFEQSFKFSFVRNPWDRTLSAYKYLVDGGNQAGDLKVASQIAKYINFDDFVINGLGEGLFRNHLMFIPQAEFVVNGNQELAVDFLGKFETIDDDFQEIVNILGVHRKLESTNTSKRDKNYKQYYQKDQSVEVVAEIYRQDINVFSYEF